jgi:alkylation response protein AidB-like acyl-CoA dehydrogenase
MTSIASVEPARDLIGGANAAAAVADEHAEQGDRQGQLSAAVVEALNRGGLFGMWVPRSIRGGVELDPISSLRVLETVSYGCLLYTNPSPRDS